MSGRVNHAPYSRRGTRRFIHSLVVLRLLIKFSFRSLEVVSCQPWFFTIRPACHTICWESCQPWFSTTRPACHPICAYSRSRIAASIVVQLCSSCVTSFQSESSFTRLYWNPFSTFSMNELDCFDIPFLAIPVD